MTEPVSESAAVVQTAREAGAVEAPQPVATVSAAPSPAREPAPRHRNLDDGIRTLPPYTRSLLKIKVPIVVTLAQTKQPVSKILQLVPGAIVQFPKSCEELLTLEAGGQNVAQGEAVKVGDKFGLRITSIELPDERFLSVRGQRTDDAKVAPFRSS